MSDIFSKQKRSEVMRNIKSKNTKLELSTKKLLRRKKIKFRSHPKIFGKPDFIIENKLILFCDSSFWHGRNWEKLKKRLEKGNNSEYWITHIENNRKRDRKVNSILKKEGCKVIRLWDSDIHKRPDWCARQIQNRINLR